MKRVSLSSLRFAGFGKPEPGDIAAVRAGVILGCFGAQCPEDLKAMVRNIPDTVLVKLI